MAELELTDERRTELAALLGDERRLRDEFPLVADYLDTAGRLAGSGDQRADAAFDLRFVHYLTGGGAGNPYWEIVAPSVSRGVVNGGRSTGSARLAYAQTLLQSAYAYAIPAPGTLDWIAEFCGSRPLLELGAGRGYWAAQLSALGLKVEAFDSEPPDRNENMSFPGSAGLPATWHEIGDLAAYSEHTSGDRDEVLMLCWPPGWGDTMASQALARFENSGGDRLVYIGEPRGGKTGDDAFFEALDSRWALESVDPHYVSWWNLTDTAQAWVRRTWACSM
ncbi:hypothetical protein [Nocardia sp. NPDC057668]|uniref:hypothetical protein n=1 Tax=Nocardia sp. NPDC057668 TaxID=3346202 RepID=UPI00366B8549